MSRPGRSAHRPVGPSEHVRHVPLDVRICKCPSSTYLSSTKTIFGSSHRIHGAAISADPACSRGSASEEELPAARAKKSLQAARARSKKTRKKKQEARINYRQQAARSKKQQARKQQAAGRHVRELVFLSIQKATLGRRLEDSSES